MKMQVPIPDLTQWVKDPALLWAVVWVTDVAQIWHCCGCGISMCHECGPKKTKKKKKKKEKIRTHNNTKLS